MSYENFPYRTPYEFGGRSVDHVTLLNVHCTVETVSGHVAKASGQCQWAMSGRFRRGQFPMTQRWMR